MIKIMNTEIDERFRLVEKSSTFKRIADTFDTYNKKVLDMGCGYGEYGKKNETK